MKYTYHSHILPIIPGNYPVIDIVVSISTVELTHNFQEFLIYLLKAITII